MIKIEDNIWIRHGSKSDEGKINLLCFPYAGGSPGIFAGWNGKVMDSINLCPVLYPGRDIRLLEAMPDKISEVAKAFVDSNPQLFTKNYTLLGYCAGGLFAYETAIYSYKKYGTVPVGLFTISFASPGYRMNSEVISADSSKESLVSYLLDNHIIPEEYATDEAFLGYYLPILGADLRAVDAYDYSVKEKVDCPIWAFFGTDDELFTAGDKRSGEEYTSQGYCYSDIEGGHYCMQDNEDYIIEIINSKLEEKMK